MDLNLFGNELKKYFGISDRCKMEYRQYRYGRYRFAWISVGKPKSFPNFSTNIRSTLKSKPMETMEPVMMEQHIKIDLAAQGWYGTSPPLPPRTLPDAAQLLTASRQGGNSLSSFYIFLLSLADVRREGCFGPVRQVGRAADPVCTLRAGIRKRAAPRPRATSGESTCSHAPSTRPRSSTRSARSVPRWPCGRARDRPLAVCG